MAKTIQVRVDDELKSNVESIFDSIGLDTATAVRIFLKAVRNNGGIPFPLECRPKWHDRDAVIRESIAQRKAGVPFIPASEFLQSIDDVINEVEAEGTYYATA